jgi:hypothetical protein
MNHEQQRLDEARNPHTRGKKWGPYLSERQWGTVREDYSDNGNAWDYCHDQAHSRAYHWDFCLLWVWSQGKDEEAL